MMVRSYQIISLLGIVFGNVLLQAEQSIEAIINSFLTRYTRAITIVEFVVGDHSRSLQSIYSNRFCYLIALGESARLYKRITSEKNHSTCALMAPCGITAEMLDTFARCESPDCVIVPVECIKQDILESLFQLGDYCIVIGDLGQIYPSPPVECIQQETSIEGKLVSIYKSYKKGLDIARWMCRLQPRNGGTKYPIVSDFNTKNLVKEGEVSTWKAGINLMTFLMLRGIYPTHDALRAQIKSMKRLDHNDLVIGNMVLQGTTLIPIDFCDTRRNSNRRRCIKAALRLFKKYRTLLLEDPRKALDAYHYLLIRR